MAQLDYAEPYKMDLFTPQSNKSDGGNILVYMEWQRMNWSWKMWHLELVVGVMQTCWIQFESPKSNLLIHVVLFYFFVTAIVFQMDFVEFCPELYKPNQAFKCSLFKHVVPANISVCICIYITCTKGKYAHLFLLKLWNTMQRFLFFVIPFFWSCVICFSNGIMVDTSSLQLLIVKSDV